MTTGTTVRHSTGVVIGFVLRLLPLVKGGCRVWIPTPPVTTPWLFLFSETAERKKLGYKIVKFRTLVVSTSHLFFCPKGS